MIQLGTLLPVTDRTGVVLAMCIKVFGPAKKRIAFLGDIILISIKMFHVPAIGGGRVKKRKRFKKGLLCRGLIVRTKVNFLRLSQVFVRFDDNALVLVTINGVPLSNRIVGPMLKEVCMKWPSVGCVCRFVI